MTESLTEWDLQFIGFKNTSCLLNNTFVEISLTCNCLPLRINWLCCVVQCLKLDMEAKPLHLITYCRQENILCLIVSHLSIHY